MGKTRRTWLLGLALCWCAPLHALNLQNLASLNFGTTDYAPPVTGSISMGTNGHIEYGPSYAGSGNGIAGQVEIQENNGTVVEISCSAAKLSGPGGLTMDIQTAATVGTGTIGNWGSGTLCTGLGNTVITHAVGVGAAANTLYIGGRLTPASVTAGSYSTVGGAGESIQIRVIIQ